MKTTDMYTNLSNRLHITLLVIVIFSVIGLHPLAAQETATGPDVTAEWDVYKRQVKEDFNKRMVELKTLIPAIVYDLRYAGTNNFMQRRMYPENTTTTYLRLPAASALLKVQQQLALQGLGLKIYDAYRPYSVTVKFWELVKDERYVANPAKGSGHNRGISVDLTVINLKTGAELNMGTDFDNFTDTAHHSFTNLPEEVIKNRTLLKSVMEKNGFKALDTEWWHYFIPDGSRYELLDIEFRKLKRDL